MKLLFPDMRLMNYKSLSQRVRVLSEQWMQEEMYCPSCGRDKLSKFPNNTKLADFFCEHCGEIYELKSKGQPIGRTILDGAYYTALERITGLTNPNLFVLQYHEYAVENLVLVPKYFFTPDILQMRNALSSSARRAGYIGSVILYDKIPAHGKIEIVKSHTECNKCDVLKNYRRATQLDMKSLESRSWLMDILKCLDKITCEIFSLKEVYAFVGELSRKHPDNHNIEAKIRQQLQILRDRGFVEFLGGGKYKKR